MDKFYVITNKSKDVSMDTTRRIQKYLEQKGKTCVLAEDGVQVPEDMECVLVLGGDGTLIRAARELRSYDVPMLGINMGTLGYLAEVEVQNIESALEQLFSSMESTDGISNYIIEERMMLKGTVEILSNKDNNLVLKDTALNDIVVTRLGTLRIIHFNIYVNGALLNTYQADGVIISTPTGSTGYNLSAGGPIVEPTASMIVITLICSHALNTRSIVLSADDEIVVEIGPGRDGKKEEAGVSFDGDRNIEVYTGDKIVIKKAKETTKLLKLSKISFLETLRKKMKGN